jgi:hypothetical protein
MTSFAPYSRHAFKASARTGYLDLEHELVLPQRLRQFLTCHPR